MRAGEILELLCYITTWTDKDQIWDAWRDDALVLRRDDLVWDNLQHLRYRDHHIMAWLIGYLNICDADIKLKAELDELNLQGLSYNHDAAERAACLRKLQKVHGGTPSPSFRTNVSALFSNDGAFCCRATSGTEAFSERLQSPAARAQASGVW